VVFVDGVAEPRTHHMGVDLGGGDIGVAKHSLDAPEVGATFEEVGGEAMAEDVWA
jgi:hypothetical protein